MCVGGRVSVGVCACARARVVRTPMKKLTLVDVAPPGLEPRRRCGFFSSLTTLQNRRSGATQLIMVDASVGGGGGGMRGEGGVLHSHPPPLTHCREKEKSPMRVHTW